MMSRTQTQEATTSAPLVEDQIRSYRRSQRCMFNTRQAARRVGQRIFGGSNPNQQILEQQIDPQAQLRLSMRERAAIAPAEALYRSRRDDAHHRVYMHRSEEAILVTNNQEDRSFIREESYDQLQRSRMRYIHLGILQVRI